MLRSCLLVSLAACVAFPANAQEISETMAKPVRHTMISPKPVVDLELCVADAITKRGGAIPIPIRDGPDAVHILGYGHTPKIIVSLIRVAGGTKIDIRTRSGDMDDRTFVDIKEICAIS